MGFFQKAKDVAMNSIGIQSKKQIDDEIADKEKYDNRIKLLSVKKFSLVVKEHGIDMEDNTFDENAVDSTINTIPQLSNIPRDLYDRYKFPQVLKGEGINVVRRKRINRGEQKEFRPATYVYKVFIEGDDVSFCRLGTMTHIRPLIGYISENEINKSPFKDDYKDSPQDKKVNEAYSVPVLEQDIRMNTQIYGGSNNDNIEFYANKKFGQLNNKRKKIAYIPIPTQNHVYTQNDFPIEKMQKLGSYDNFNNYLSTPEKEYGPDKNIEGPVLLAKFSRYPAAVNIFDKEIFLYNYPYDERDDYFLDLKKFNEYSDAYSNKDKKTKLEEHGGSIKKKLSKKRRSKKHKSKKNSRRTK